MKAEDLTNGGEAAISNLKTVGAQEGLNLESKSGRVFQGGALTHQSKELLASALSSLSNSAGGILVIGIDCRKIQGVDCVQNLAPIENLSAALTSCTDLIGDALQPRHDGIKVTAIPCESDPNAGYLVIDIPRSDRRPHMNQINKRYYKRAGASKFPMEHYDIEDAFRRNASPSLELAHRLVGGFTAQQGGATKTEISLELFLYNTGRVSAKNPVIQLLYVGPYDEGGFALEPKTIAVRSEYAGIVTLTPLNAPVVHPGDRQKIETLRFTISNEPSQTRIGRVPADGSPLTIIYRCLAENFGSPDRILNIDLREMYAAARR